MAKLEALTDVGIFTRDQKRARSFYTRKVGLKVRDYEPEFGYLALGATKTGKDASLTVWEPDREGFGEDYDAAVKQIGEVTGVGFRTSSLEKTVEMLKRRNVKVEVSEEEAEGPFARFWDDDGNVLFAFEPPKVKARRAGFSSLDWVTLVTRNTTRADEFFTKALKMRARRTPYESFSTYRLSPEGTAIMPFTPQKEMYANPADYDTDMSHVGENTWIMFTTSDVHAIQETLLSRGVRFKTKVQEAEWGTFAEFYDNDDNEYMVVEPR